MSKFKIPVEWKITGTLEIEANSLKEAKTKAEASDQELPVDSFYLEGSFQVIDEIAEEMNDDNGIKPGYK